MILSLFLLRGLPFEHAASWLSNAFQSQRPTIATRSANFPNFDKFQNVVLMLASEIRKRKPWIDARVFDCVQRSTALSEDAEEAKFRWFPRDTEWSSRMTVKCRPNTALQLLTERNVGVTQQASKGMVATQQRGQMLRAYMPLKFIPSITDIIRTQRPREQTLEKQRRIHNTSINPTNATINTVLSMVI